MDRINPIFISIDGHGGSGKSSLAKMLAESLGAEIIHIDDFTGVGAKTDWYKALINKVINPSLNGAKLLSYPRAKWWPEHMPLPVVNQRVTSVMIIEGVCSSRVELRSYMTVKVFVDTPRSICVERGVARDKGMGGKSDEEILAQWHQWLKWDDQYFAKDDPKSAADIIVSGINSYEKSLNTILSKMNYVLHSSKHIH